MLNRNTVACLPMVGLAAAALQDLPAQSLSPLAGRVARGRGLTHVARRAAPSTHARVVVTSTPTPVFDRGKGIPLLRPGHRPRAADALVVPAPGLVSAPPVGGRLGFSSATSRPWSCALLGTHGGAGVSMLLRAGLSDLDVCDAGRVWPRFGAVVLVARTSIAGLEAARGAARQHAAGAAGPDLQLLGLVLVADAPGRLPERAGRFADLLCGAFTRTWQIPWLQEWRLASATEALPVHPEVRRLFEDLRSLTSDGSIARGEKS
jgi:hypothetical protein